MAPPKRKSQPRKSRGRGRPSKCTPELTARICELVRSGNFLETAAWSAGIDDKTLHNWRNWGSDGREPYKFFFQAVKQAEADSEIALVERMRSGEQFVWVAAATLLERRFRKRWSRGELDYDLRQRLAVAQVEETEARRDLARAKSRGEVIDVNVLDAEAVKDIFERRHGFPAITKGDGAELVGSDVPPVSAAMDRGDPE